MTILLYMLGNSSLFFAFVGFFACFNLEIAHCMRNYGAICCATVGISRQFSQGTITLPLPRDSAEVVMFTGKKRPLYQKGKGDIWEIWKTW